MDTTFKVLDERALQRIIEAQQEQELLHQRQARQVKRVRKQKEEQKADQALIQQLLAQETSVNADVEQNGKKVNDALESNQNSLTTPDEIFAKLSQYKFWSVIDVFDAFLQAELDNEEKKLLTINTPFGLQPGVKTALGMFQQLMDTMMAGAEGICVFKDNFIVGGVDEEDHRNNLFEALKRLQDYGFRLKIEKCSFGKEEIEFLGHIIDANGIRPNPDKIAVLQSIPARTDVQQLQAQLQASTTTSSQQLNWEEEMVTTQTSSHSEVLMMKGNFHNKQQSTQSQASPPSPCFMCSEDHWVAECSFKEKTCYTCGRVGHKAGHCSSAEAYKQHQERKHNSSSPLTYGINAGKQSTRKFVKPFIAGKQLELLFDSGSDWTIISPANWKFLGSPKLIKCNEQAVSASGDPVKIIGKFKTRVNLHGRRSHGGCYVSDLKINIFGSDWMKMLGLWNMSMTSIHNRTHLTSTDSIQESSWRKCVSSKDTAQESPLNKTVASSIAKESWRNQSAEKASHKDDNKKFDHNSNRHTFSKISGSKFNAMINQNNPSTKQDKQKDHTSKQNEKVVITTPSSRGAAIVKNIHVPSRLSDKANVKNQNAPGDVRKASIKNENAPNPNVNQTAGIRSPVTEDGNVNCFAIETAKQLPETFTELKENAGQDETTKKLAGLISQFRRSRSQSFAIKRDTKVTKIPRSRRQSANAWTSKHRFNFALQHARIATERSTQATRKKVAEFINNGWPREKQIKDERVAKNFVRRDLLMFTKNCSFFGDRVVTPKCFRPTILKTLHDGHPGVALTNLRARTKVYWPSIDNDIEKMVKTCNECAINAKSPLKSTLQPLSGKTWPRVHIDYAGPVNNFSYLVVEDVFSNGHEFYKVSTTTTQKIIDCLEDTFSRQGLCDTIVSDNDAQFTTGQFKNSCTESGIKHINTAPFHPRSNNQVEQMVGVLKTALKKLESEGNINHILQKFLICYRFTPQYALRDKSSFHLMTGRIMATKLDLLKPPTEHEDNRDEAMKSQFNAHNGAKWKKFEVYKRDFAKIFTNNVRKWTPGIIIERHKAVNYLILAQNPTGDRQVLSHETQLKRRSNMIVRNENPLFDGFDVKIPIPERDLELQVDSEAKSDDETSSRTPNFAGQPENAQQLPPANAVQPAAVPEPAATPVAPLTRSTRTTAKNPPTRLTYSNKGRLN